MRTAVRGVARERDARIARWRRGIAKDAIDGGDAMTRVRVRSRRFAAVAVHDDVVVDVNVDVDV
ncbi:MAG: hypothetical protein MUE69_16385, partial [Myxococcota bacterium]|nr:hypothetical protein [Myxococcota bacterium]